MSPSNNDNEYIWIYKLLALTRCLTVVSRSRISAILNASVIPARPRLLGHSHRGYRGDFAATDVAAAVEIFAAAAGAPLLQPQVTEELRR